MATPKRQAQINRARQKRIAARPGGPGSYKPRTKTTWSPGGTSSPGGHGLPGSPRTGGTTWAPGGPVAPKGGTLGSPTGTGFKPGTAATPAVAAQKPGQPGFVADSQYNAETGQSKEKYTDTVSDIGTEERRTEREFGLVDPTDPFSRANELKRDYLKRKAGASAGLAAQGQLYSGAHERALSRVRLDEERSSAELRQAYEDAKAKHNQAKLDAGETLTENDTASFEDWQERNPEGAAGSAAKPGTPGTPGSTPTLTDANTKGITNSPVGPGVNLAAPKTMPKAPAQSGGTGVNLPAPKDSPATKDYNPKEAALRKRLAKARANKNTSAVKRLRKAVVKAKGKK